LRYQIAALVSEQILDGTSAQLGYIVPFTSVDTYAGKYVTEDKSRTHITTSKDNPEQANNTKYSKNKTTLVQSPFTTRGQEARWAYSTNNAPDPTWGRTDPRDMHPLHSVKIRTFNSDKLGAFAAHGFCNDQMFRAQK